MLSSKQRRRAAPPLIACALALLAVAAIVVHHHFDRVRAVKTGDRVPALAMMSLNGDPVTLRPLEHGITVYNIFTTWCPGCREETPGFARIAQRLRARGVRVVGIDQGEPSAPIASFATQFGLDYPIVIDTGHVSNAVLGARVIPQTVVVKDGVVTSIAVGPITPQTLEAMIGTV